MTAQRHHKFTPEEYLAFERKSHERHEYLRGEIFAMVGGSERHAWITARLLAHLFPSLQTYVLVSQKVARIGRFVRREGEAWDWRVTEGLDSTFELMPLRIALPLAQGYQGVEFDISEDE